MIRPLAGFHDHHNRSVGCYFDPDDRDRFINAPGLNVHRSAHTPPLPPRGYLKVNFVKVKGGNSTREK